MGRVTYDAIRAQDVSVVLATTMLASVLVVLGKKEVAKVKALMGELNPKIRRLFQETEQLHDGRWLWIPLTSQSDMETIKLLLGTKRRPKPIPA